MKPDKRRTTPLVQLLATGWSHAHGGKPRNLVPSRWRMTAVGKVDAHSRLLVDGRFYDRGNARICEELLRRAITRRGIPDILYFDNGAPFLRMVADPAAAKQVRELAEEAEVGPVRVGGRPGQRW